MVKKQTTTGVFTKVFFLFVILTDLTKLRRVPQGKQFWQFCTKIISDVLRLKRKLNYCKVNLNLIETACWKIERKSSPFQPTIQTNRVNTKKKVWKLVNCNEKSFQRNPKVINNLMWYQWNVIFHDCVLRCDVCMYDTIQHMYTYDTIYVQVSTQK